MGGLEQERESNGKLHWWSATGQCLASPPGWSPNPYTSTLRGIAGRGALARGIPPQKLLGWEGVFHHHGWSTKYWEYSPPPRDTMWLSTVERGILLPLALRGRSPLVAVGLRFASPTQRCKAVDGSVKESPSTAKASPGSMLHLPWPELLHTLGGTRWSGLGKLFFPLQYHQEGKRVQAAWEESTRKIKPKYYHKCYKN